MLSVLNPSSVESNLSNDRPKGEFAMISETTTQAIRIIPPIDPDCKNSLKDFKLMLLTMLVKISKRQLEA